MNHDDKQLKHLEMIQEVITRMGTNSFQIKSWAIMVLSALLALFASSANELYILVACVPIFIFWIIDTFYLQQERKLVEIYNRVANGDTKIKPFTMPLNLCNHKRCGFWRCFFSKTIFSFYGGCTTFLAVAFILLYHNVITFNKISL